MIKFSLCFEFCFRKLQYYDWAIYAILIIIIVRQSGWQLGYTNQNSEGCLVPFNCTCSPPQHSKWWRKCPLLKGTHAMLYPWMHISPPTSTCHLCVRILLLPIYHFNNLTDTKDSFNKLCPSLITRNHQHHQRVPETSHMWHGQSY